VRRKARPTGRESVRWREWRYDLIRYYFVTICAQQMRCIFGEVEDGQMVLNPVGQIVADVWRELPSLFDSIRVEESVVMPNHFHGIVWIAFEGGLPLGSIVGAFKSVTTKRINLLRGTPGAQVWQRNYWDRVLRNDRERSRVRAYIVQNPELWGIDRLNPGCGRTHDGVVPGPP
jgi:putative transposase